MLFCELCVFCEWLWFLWILGMELEKGGENPDNQAEASDRMKMV